MNSKIKDGLFIAGLIVAAFFIVQLALQNNAQDDAFQVFKEDSERRQAEAFAKIDSLRTQDEAAGEIIERERADREALEEELFKIKNTYVKKTNFRAFSNDSLSRYFAERRRQR